MAAGKNKFAAVFNLDKHNENGSHWISLFINAQLKIIMFFDSANGKIPPEISRFIKKVKQQGLETGIKFKFLRNEKQHQRGNTECGVYAIHFIVEMLNNANRAIELFLNGYIPDNKIEKYRKIYFNAPEKVNLN
jgi:Ulp1 family protease